MNFKPVFAFGVAALLGACGGGGGDGGTSTSPATVKFDAGNYVAASKEAFSGVNTINSLGSTTLGAASVPTDFMVKLATRKALQEITKKRPNRSNLLSGIVEEYSEACTGGGAFTVVESDKDGDYDTVDPGDYVKLTYKACKETIGTMTVTLNGEMTVTMVSYKESGTNESGTVDIAMKSLSFASTLQSGSLDGTLRTSFEYTGSSDETRLEMAVVNGLVAKIKLASAAEKTWTYSNGFSIKGMVSDSLTTAEASGKAANAELGTGTITYSTPTPIRIVNNSQFPVAGVMMLKAEAGGTTRIEAAGVNAKVSLDQNDDGTFETSTLVPWSEILNR